MSPCDGCSMPTPSSKATFTPDTALWWSTFPRPCRIFRGDKHYKLTTDEEMQAFPPSSHNQLGGDSGFELRALGIQSPCSWQCSVDSFSFGSIRWRPCMGLSRITRVQFPTLEEILPMTLWLTLTLPRGVKVPQKNGQDCQYCSDSKIWNWLYLHSSHSMSAPSWQNGQNMFLFV